MKPTTTLFALALASLATAALADNYKLGTLEIEQPWARATPKGAKTAAGYVTIKNTGTTPDRLTGGSLADAGRVQLHEMTRQGDVMRMRPLPGGVEIKPGETVELKPDGMHLMFLDLKAPLVKGQTVKGTLTFAASGTVDVAFDVKGIGAAGGGEQMRMDHMKVQ